MPFRHDQYHGQSECKHVCSRRSPEHPGNAKHLGQDHDARRQKNHIPSHPATGIVSRPLPAFQSPGGKYCWPSGCRSVKFRPKRCGSTALQIRYRARSHCQTVRSPPGGTVRRSALRFPLPRYWPERPAGRASASIRPPAGSWMRKTERIWDAGNTRRSYCRRQSGPNCGNRRTLHPHIQPKNCHRVQNQVYHRA